MILQDPKTTAGNRTLADLHIRDPPLRDQTPDEPDPRPEPGRHLGPVDEPDWGGVGLCDLTRACLSSHIHQRRVELRKRVRKLSNPPKFSPRSPVEALHHKALT